MYTCAWINWFLTLEKYGTFSVISVTLDKKQKFLSDLTGKNEFEDFRKKIKVYSN